MIRRRPGSSSLEVFESDNVETRVTGKKHKREKGTSSFATTRVLYSSTAIRRFVVLFVVILALAVVCKINKHVTTTRRHPITIWIDHHNLQHKQPRQQPIVESKSKRLLVKYNIKNSQHNVNKDDSSPSIDKKDANNNNKDHQCSIPMADWQIPSNSPWTCNSLHELGIAHEDAIVEFLDCGGDRCAFQVQDSQYVEIVFKTPRFEKNKYTPKDYITNWRDTIAMERLSSSPFVLDLYGNCGNSQIAEYAPGLYLYAQIYRAKDTGEFMTPQDRLRIGYHVASAVADVHSIDGSIAPSLAHNDLCCDQYLLSQQGVYKLNDFHLSSMMHKDESGNVCPEPPRGMKRYLDKTRSPESLAYRDNHGKLIHRDKSDVWMMGNVLYYVLAKKWCFEGITTKKARRLLLKGKHSVIPPQILNSTDAADQTMVKAIELAWTYNATKRPSAQQIANLLKNQLVNLTAGSEEDDPLFPVNLPPFSDSFSETGEDWNKNYQ